MNDTSASATHTQSLELSGVVVPLLKGVLYADADGRAWSALLSLQAKVRDYVAVMGLDLVLDESEGYAFLRSTPVDDEGAEATAPGKRPRLVARRPLSFPVSLLLALLRKRLAEFDSGGADTRLVLRRNDIVDLLRMFLPQSTNEARLVDQVDVHINRVADLGFLRRLKGSANEEASYEVRRILKAFVDAQWLADFDARLAAYREHVEHSDV
jgi:hypothetical protein